MTNEPQDIGVQAFVQHHSFEIMCVYYQAFALYQAAMTHKLNRSGRYLIQDSLSEKKRGFSVRS